VSLAEHPTAVDPRVVRIVQRVLGSPKYRAVQAAMVERIATAVARTTAKDDEAVKVVKRQLHQAYGAFLAGKPAPAVDRAIARVGGDPNRVKAAFAEAMRAHASTAERLPYIESYADMLRGWCGAPRSVIDFGCGLAPLMLPWLSIPPTATYWCCDIDVELVAALNRIAPLLSVRFEADAVDLVADRRERSAELGLALKLVTTLEAQRDGAATDVLRRLHVDHLVISVPAASLGGGRRYMTDPVAQVAEAVEGTTYVIADDRRLGDEHYAHLVRSSTPVARRIPINASE
jgi:16S rRNA (guanine(1405)-N(7))-methyltransferase